MKATIHRLASKSPEARASQRNSTPRLDPLRQRSSPRRSRSDSVVPIGILFKTKSSIFLSASSALSWNYLGSETLLDKTGVRFLRNIPREVSLTLTSPYLDRKFPKLLSLFFFTWQPEVLPTVCNFGKVTISNQLFFLSCTSYPQSTSKTWVRVVSKIPLS